MSSNGQRVDLPQGVLVDLFAATTFTPPMQLAIHNRSVDAILANDPAAPPLNSDDFTVIEPYQDSATASAANEFWAVSQYRDGVAIVYDPNA